MAEATQEDMSFEELQQQVEQLTEQLQLKETEVEQLKEQLAEYDEEQYYEEYADEQQGHLEFELTEEEKEYGEDSKFWQFDELFLILDVFGEGSLTPSAFKHGLHALGVELEDTEMDSVFEQMNKSQSGKIAYKEFLRYMQFIHLLPPQSQKLAGEILKALPKVAANRRQFVTRGAMVIKYASKNNLSSADTNNYLLNKGLTRAEIDAGWKQYRFNTRAIPDVDFAGLALSRGKLVSMSALHKNIQPFGNADFRLFKLLKRAGHRSFEGTEFNDLSHLRAAGLNARISVLRCWFDRKSSYFNGLQIIYQCSDGETELKAPRHVKNIGSAVEQSEMELHADELIIGVTVYFAHFVCGLHVETTLRKFLFGTDHCASKIALRAPDGASICAFYGSISRLVESLGVYVVSSDQGSTGVQRKKSKRNKKQSNRRIVAQSSAVSVSADSDYKDDEPGKEETKKSFLGFKK